MAKLTTRTLATGVTLNDLIHIVITGDTSQDPDGSSYKSNFSQVLPLFGGSSGNCISDFYVQNIHACIDEITVHNRVQAIGSDAQSLLSFAFGGNVQALERYTHAEGLDTIAFGTTSHSEGSGTTSFGSYSHSEGVGSRTGTNNGYLATGLTPNALYLDSSYGDVTSRFVSDQFIYLDDQQFIGSSLIDEFRKVSGATFVLGQTIVYLLGVTLFTASQVIVGDTGQPNTWLGDMTVGGYGANSKGKDTSSIGEYSISLGYGGSASGTNSFSSGKGNKVFGDQSASFGNDNQIAGTSSFIIGSNSTLNGNLSMVVGTSNQLYSNESFAGGTGNISNSDTSFIFSKQSTISNTQGAILGGNVNLIQSGDTNNSSIIGGQFNTISGLAPSDPTTDSVILGGSGNTISSHKSAIIGGSGNIVNGSRTVILGGDNISGTSSDTTYVSKFVIYYSGTPTGTTDTNGEPGSVLWDDSYLYYKDYIGWKRLSGATW